MKNNTLESVSSDFIKRAQKFCQPSIEKNDFERKSKVNKWNKENRPFLNAWQNKYEKTYKGKYARSLIRSKRGKFDTKDDCVNEKDKFDIGNFYLKCPVGYVVDHIIPVSKGGKHCLMNLQYLTIKENRIKSNIIHKKYLSKNLKLKFAFVLNLSQVV